GDTADGGAPARRAVIRWAWRLFRREWRQQLLILSLITVVVAGTIAGGAVAINTPAPPSAASFGTANHLVVVPGTDPHLAAGIAAIRHRFGPADVIENEDLATGSAGPVQLRAQDPHGPYGQPTLALVSGRYPAGPDQVALTSQVAALYNVRAGGTWHQGGHARRVTGIVENPSQLSDEFALVAPGQVSTPAQVTILFDASARAVAGFRFPAGATVQTPVPSPSGIGPVIIVLALAVLGLIFIGLVAVAGFTVLAQRRLRALGMLGSLGAADRHVRLVMTANGAIAGLTGTMAGAAAGFAAWFAYRPSLEASAGHQIDPLHLPWWLIVTGMVLAIATATAAASRPARAVARISPHAALAGRPEPPRAAHRSVIPGIVLLLTGPGLLVLAGGWGHNGGTATLETLGGLVATIAGGLLLAPFCITGLAALGRQAPVAVRLALRDLARYRTRSAAALSAIVFAVVMAMLICILATARYANVLDYTGPNLTASQLILYPPAAGGGPGPAGSPGAANPRPLPRSREQALVARITAALASPSVLTLYSAVRPGSHVAGYPGPLQATLNQAGTQTNNYSGPLYVATPALLRSFGISPSRIRPAADVLTMRPGLAAEPRMQLLLPPSSPPGPGQGGSADPCPAGRCIARPAIEMVTGLPSGTSAPNTVITLRTVRALGLREVTSGWLIQATQPLTAAQINSARQLAVAADAAIETKSGAVSLAEILNGATAVGLLIALGVLAMTVGLIRSETGSDLRTLAAAGASGTTRRAITAATAGGLGLLGAVIGTAIAYLAAIAWYRSSLATTVSHVPVRDLIVVLAGLPLAAWAGGWLFAGRTPAAIARQPLE
ncbi:MAG: FtsX-like permease family protein, partial [Streptosporangiaceae bacterium]